MVMNIHQIEKNKSSLKCLCRIIFFNRLIFRIIIIYLPDNVKIVINHINKYKKLFYLYKSNIIIYFLDAIANQVKLRSLKH